MTFYATHIACRYANSEIYIGEKSLQQMVFLSGQTSEYEPDSTVLEVGDRTGTAVLTRYHRKPT